MAASVSHTFVTGETLTAANMNANPVAEVAAINANDLTIMPQILQSALVGTANATTLTATLPATAISGNLLVGFVASGRNDISTPVGYSSYQSAFRLESVSRYGYLFFRTANGTSADNLIALPGASTDIGIVLVEFTSASTGGSPLYGYSNGWAAGPCKIAATKATWVLFLQAVTATFPTTPIGPLGFTFGPLFQQSTSTYQLFWSPMSSAATFTFAGVTGLAFGVNHA
jgi:hypothetical protein